MLDPLNRFIKCQHKSTKFISKIQFLILLWTSTFEWKECVLTFLNKNFRFTESDFRTLKRVYANNTDVQMFIDNYDERDVAAVTLDSNSTSLWTISPPNLRRFIYHLHGNATMKFRFSVSLSRVSYNPSTEQVHTSQVFHLTEADAARQELLSALNKYSRNRQVQLVNLLPKFLKVWDRLSLKLTHY